MSLIKPSIDESPVGETCVGFVPRFHDGDPDVRVPMVYTILKGMNYLPFHPIELREQIDDIRRILRRYHRAIGLFANDGIHRIVR